MIPLRSLSRSRNRPIARGWPMRSPGFRLAVPPTSWLDGCSGGTNCSKAARTATRRLPNDFQNENPHTAGGSHTDVSASGTTAPGGRVRVPTPPGGPGGAGGKAAGGATAERAGAAERAVSSPGRAEARGSDQSAESAESVGGGADSDTVACRSAVGDCFDWYGHNGSELFWRSRQSGMGRVHRIAGHGNRGRPARDSPAGATTVPDGSPEGVAY